MASQTINGKAFEFALISEFYQRLRQYENNTVLVINNSTYQFAKNCFEGFDDKEKDLYRLAASSAVNFLVDLEPRLSNGIGNDDILHLEIVSDKEGQIGDVRDVIAIRALQKWEIGVSAKNNHRAVKHSRLSKNLDFGAKWLGYSCSTGYFQKISEIFDFLSELRYKDKNAKWSEIPNMHDRIYVPILEAFKNELIRLCLSNPDIVPAKLIQYLIGTKDFYKIIKGKRKVEIQAFNIHGTLNKSLGKVVPKAKIPKLKLPTRLIEIVYSKGSKTTLIVSLDEGWQISFRIHSASSRIESSLKFDINLVSAPYSLFSNHIFL